MAAPRLNKSRTECRDRIYWVIRSRPIRILEAPCLENCQHIQCCETRQVAAYPCRVCGKPIGYDKRFFFEGGSKQFEPSTPYVHAICVKG